MSPEQRQQLFDARDALHALWQAHRDHRTLPDDVSGSLISTALDRVTRALIEKQEITA